MKNKLKSKEKRIVPVRAAVDKTCKVGHSYQDGNFLNVNALF